MFERSEKKKAIALRKQGYSFREISDQLGIAKSTTSLWLRDVKLSRKAQKRIRDLGVNGRKKAVETNKAKRVAEDVEIARKVEEYFTSRSQRIDSRIACALLYWGEGSKYNGNASVSFINADPVMIKYFLRVFRDSFDLDEKKFRALVHVHEYHNIEEQVRFWSAVTSIPVEQFHKSYQKKNSGKNKKENYQGCVSVTYSDIRIYKELMFIIKKLTEIL